MRKTGNLSKIQIFQPLILTLRFFWDSYTSPFGPIIGFPRLIPVRAGLSSSNALGSTPVVLTAFT